jgi:hypothetical protein
VLCQPQRSQKTLFCTLIVVRLCDDDFGKELAYLVE